MSGHRVSSSRISDGLSPSIQSLSKTHLDSVRSVAKGAGELLLQAWESPLGEKASFGKDIKLLADEQSERFIIEQLQVNSDYPILGEENGWVDGVLPSNEQPYWVIDPLDGTFNYSRKIPLCSLSIALFVGDIPVLGALNNFALGELFYGSAEGPVFCNDQTVSVSNVTESSKSCLATGFPVLMNYSEESLRSYIASVQNYKKVRCYGSACYAITQVISGRVEAYKEDGVRLWDVGAGLALVAGAGGSWSFEHVDREHWVLNVTAGNSQKAID